MDALREGRMAKGGNVFIHLLISIHIPDVFIAVAFAGFFSSLALKSIFHELLSTHLSVQTIAFFHNTNVKPEISH